MVLGDVAFGMQLGHKVELSGVWLAQLETPRSLLHCFRQVWLQEVSLLWSRRVTSAEIGHTGTCTLQNCKKHIFVVVSCPASISRQTPVS